MNTETLPVYCSLDIETSGFDPKTCEVLEVGLAFFTLDETGARITEEWTCVCKPSGPVAPQILSLTGLSQEELDGALPFSHYKDTIQKKIAEAVIVGHNIIFDINFLKGFGMEFSGKTVDTLDLVQFLMPTHHSYNLENLMHVFLVPYADAHRALSDAKACITVLERLMGLFQSFPPEAKKEVMGLVSRRSFSWGPMLKINVQPKKNPEPAAAPTASDSQEHAELKSRTVYKLPSGGDCIERSVGVVGGSSKKTLLVVPRQATVMRLWKEGKVYGIVSPDTGFSEKKFQEFLNKGNLSEEETRFALKVLVWKYTNWQTETIADLNLSFFGGQFRSYITGGKPKVQKKDKIICTDMATFEVLAQQKLYRDRLVAIVGLQEFEQQVSQHLSTKVSWSYVTYILNSYYNFEFQRGDPQYEKPVRKGLNAADLFFGLANALLKISDGFSYCKITPAFEYSEQFGKVRAAAGNFCATLEEVAAALGSVELRQAAQSLKLFFEADPSSVRWIELADNRCVFHSSPLHINDIVARQLAPYEHIVLMDNVSSPQMLSHHLSRLGLEDFTLEAVGDGKKIQGELFSGNTAPSAACELRSNITPEELMRILTPEKLPAAVLFGSALQVRQFSENHFKELKTKSSLLVQNGGGGSRLLRNFGIYPDSLLLATDKFILKSITGAGTGTIEHLPVKTLIICHLPFEQFTHPYQEALSALFANPFEEYSLPKAVQNLHSLLEFFATPVLERVYICDDKLDKSYSHAFKTYLDSAGFLRIS